MVAGALFLAGEFIQVDVGAYGWPFFVIIPGLILLGLGTTVRGGSGLAIPGGIVTMTGLVLLFQNATGLWASWAYAWALVAPGGVGLGLFVQGIATANARVRAAGVRVMTVGVALFLAGFAFFEGALHIDGADFGLVGKVALPALLVAAGLWLLIRNLRGPVTTVAVAAPADGPVPAPADSDLGPGPEEPR